MVDFAGISAALSTLSVAIKFLKGSLEKIKDTAVREKVEELLNSIIPLQSEIIALQEANLSYVKEIQNLEKKLREVEDWAKEVESYELKQLSENTHVYVKKSESGRTEPVVYFCPNCFDINHKKSILQNSTKRGYILTCLNCKSDFFR